MDRILKFAEISRSWPVVVQYLVTTFLVIAAFSLRLIVIGTDHGYPYLLYFPVIIAASLLFDRGNGIYCTVLSGALAAFFVLPPENSVDITHSADTIAFAIFIVTGIVIAVFFEALHKAFVRMMHAHQELSVAAHTREVLMRELAHRTRNDMSALNSLFLLQAHTLHDPEAKHAFEKAAERMQILARVHQRLSYAEDKVVIDSKQFITDLCEDLRISRFAGRPISLELSVDSHRLSHEKAVAIGLIINELVTNTLKYAFPGNKTGKVGVCFDQKGNTYRFRVFDDGVGYDHQAPLKGSGLGLQLVRTLAAQLGGTLETIPVEKGSSFEVCFPVKTNTGAGI